MMEARGFERDMCMLIGRGRGDLWGGMLGESRFVGEEVAGVCGHSWGGVCEWGVCSELSVLEALQGLLELMGSRDPRERSWFLAE